MTQLVNQPEGTGTVRKVQYASWASAGMAPVAAVFSYQLAGMIVSFVPYWQSNAAYEAVALLVELLLTGILTGTATWATGYMVRARSGDSGQ